MQNFPSNLPAGSAATAAAAAAANDRYRPQWCLSQTRHVRHVYAQGEPDEQIDSTASYHTATHTGLQSQTSGIPQLHTESNDHTAFGHNSFDDFVNYPNDLENEKVSHFMQPNLQGAPNSFSFRPLDHTQPNWLIDNNFPQYEQLPPENWTTGTTDFEGSSVSSVNPRDYYTNTPEDPFNNTPVEPSQMYYNNPPTHPNPMTADYSLAPNNNFPHAMTPSNASYFQPNPAWPLNFHSWLNTQAQSAQSRYVSMDQVVQPTSRLNSTTPYVASSYQSPFDNYGGEGESEEGIEKCGKSEDDEADGGSNQTAETVRQYSPTHGGETTIVRGDRDRLLMKLRAEGWKYKDIKRTHGFVEAESTLRGRLRTLTKKKEQRVRKPEWQAKDVTLLRNAVNHYNGDCKLSAGQIHRKTPWKKVSERMTARGASYAFAASTCAKKWDEEFGDGKLQ